jgi:DNA mismatch repair protein MutS
MNMKILDKSNYTPMMQQYLTIKENYQDSLIFFRLGDFYELFFNDALVASRVLEIALTGREAGVEERVPMCGVPHHSASNYIQRLVDNGFKVAIVEQVEDPKDAKGIVKRDVVRLITPGTVMDEQYLNEKDNSYIASVTDSVTNYLVSYCDLTTGSTYVTLLDKNDAMLKNELLSINAKEIVCADSFDASILNQMVQEYQLTLSIENEVDMPEDYQYIVADLTDSRYQLAVGRLVNYLLKTQKRDLKHLQKAESYQSNQYLMLDVYSKRNLELTETLRTHTRKGSLLWLIDKAETAMGSRMIKQWLEKPLINAEEINWRYDFVQAMLDDFIIREEIRNHLKEIYDLERLVGRIAYDHANAKDLLQLKRSLNQVPFIKEQLAHFNNEILRHLNHIKDFKALTDLLEAGIHEEAPYTLKDGGLINDGFSKELDEYRDIAKNGKAYLANLVQRERERTGIKNLKIGFNKVFGYYIEITKGNLNSLPPDLGYERKQTLANAERFITPELKEMEAKILNSEERAVNLEYELFIEIRNEIKNHIPDLQVLAKSIAIIDALISFAVVSNENRFTRPHLADEHRIKIINGRHPVVEKVLTDSIYVENDILMDEETNVLLITGPNMSGKSTYMRQMALTVIMAQIGCFVPCDVCEMKIFDKIYTRIGASDDLASGQSTFMVEMLEANNAILNASKDSLILFDEIGRGTATFDGMALAQSIIEYIHEKIGCKMLFSTHYHELTVLENQLNQLKNVHVRAEEHQGELTFLHKVEFGPSDKSYGIQVAKLAKLPNSVIKRAEKILIKLEKNKTDVVEEPEINLFNLETEAVVDPFADEMIASIKGMNVSEMTPIEALNTLYQIQTKIKNQR